MEIKKKCTSQEQKRLSGEKGGGNGKGRAVGVDDYTDGQDYDN